MLANLLPGIRDIRTPLATGYLWLLTFWLWIPSHFKLVPPTTGVPGDITRLSHYATRAGVGIAISFVAYLIGILSKSLNPPLVRLGTSVAYIPTIIKNLVSGSEFLSLEIRFTQFWQSPFLYYSGRKDNRDREFEDLELRFAKIKSIVTAALAERA